MTERAPSPAPKLPVSLAANPRLSSWLDSRREGQVTVSPGKVEIGQGIVTALAQIAADELDVDIGRVQMIRASTASQPQRGRHLGQPFRPAVGPRHTAGLRRSPANLSSSAAADRLGVGIDALDIEDGTISGPGNVRTSYWELAEHVSLDRDATPGAVPKAVRAARAGRKFRSAAGYPRQGFRASALHPRCRPCRACCMAACCDRKCRRRNSPH